MPRFIRAIPKTSPLYPLLQWTLFPLIMFGPLFVAAWLLQAGASDTDAGASPLVVGYSVVLAIGLTIFLFEQLMPYRPQWNKPDGDQLTDVISSSIAYIILPILLKPLFTTLLLGLTIYLAQQFGTDIWPDHWPIWAQLVIGLLAIDAGRYWGHRACHEIPWLWRFHANHHSPNRLWFFNAPRQHPVDRIVFLFSEMLFPVLLGANGDVLVLMLIVTSTNGFFQHTNMDVKLGWFYYIFNTVDLHRWHHSKLEAESNHNYGNNLITYDLIFGSYFRPADREVGEIGVLNPDYPKGYWGQFMAPFRRGKLDKEIGRKR